MSQSQRMSEVWDTFGAEYLVSNYATAYHDKGIVVPLGDDFGLDNDIRPPVVNLTRRGRPPTRRIRSQGETGPASVYRRRARQGRAGDAA